MREILFRGKRIDNGERVEGDLLRSRGKCYIHMNLDPFDYLGELSGFIKMYEVDPETVCEFTGLTDKNGKKIFEGDIIAIDEDSIYYHTASGPVRTYKGMWVSFYLPDAHGRDCYDELYRINAEREVIGNIHDNPELLKEDKQ